MIQNMIPLGHMKGVVGLFDETGSWFCYLAPSSLISGQSCPWQGPLEPERMSTMMPHLMSCGVARFG